MISDPGDRPRWWQWLPDAIAGIVRALRALVSGKRDDVG